MRLYCMISELIEPFSHEWNAKCLKTVHEYEKGYVREENTKKYYYTFKTADLKERPWKNKHQNCAEN